jgi:hypothetical protein
MSSLPPAYDSRPNVGTTLTPYLQLSHRLSLTWLAYPILSLVFVVFRLILSGDAAQDAVNNAKGDMLAACVAAQEAAASGASFPRYMALGMNELVVKSTNAALDATRQALVLALTIMEAVINFVIDTYRSTFLCFLELIIRGALSIIISATQEVRSRILAERRIVDLVLGVGFVAEHGQWSADYNPGLRVGLQLGCPGYCQ